MRTENIVGTLLSVNVGGPRTIEWAGRRVVTSIWKEPVAGRVAVAGINVAGDLQSDRRVHGGRDKAVYVYSIDDYRWWTQQLGSPVEPATFGENLTVEGIDLAAAVVGEVWVIGSARFAVTQPRQPCFKLGIRMGASQFVQRFARAERYGVYLRIVADGDVGAGDTVTVQSRPADGETAYSLG